MSFGLGDAFKEFRSIVANDAHKEINNIRDGTTKRVIKQQIREKTDFHPVLSDLNRTPNSRFDDQMLAQRLVAKYQDPERIKQAIDSILVNDGRFNNTQSDEFEVDHSRLTTIKSEVEKFAKQEQKPDKKTENTTDDKTAFSNCVDRVKKSVSSRLDSSSVPIRKVFTGKTLEEHEKSKKTKEEKQMAKLTANIAADLVGIVNRKPVSAGNFQDTNGKGYFLKQTHGHIEDGAFIEGYAISAELANKDEKVMELANQAVITSHESDHPDEAYEVILGRSGRSDSESKIDDKSMLDILERLKSTSKKGLREMKDSQGHVFYEYQRADITMMDTNPFKSAGTTVLSGAKRLSNFIQKNPLTPIESERQFVHAKRKATENKWASGALDPSRGRRYLERDVTVDGQTHKVREYEPLVWNFVFSSSAESPRNVKNARKDNIPSALYLFSEYQKQDPTVQNLFSKYNDTTKNEKKQLAEALKEELKNEKSTLSKDQKLVLQAVLVTLTGKDSDEANYDTKYGSDTQYMLLNHLADMTGTAITVECKSGNDRTATAKSLRCSLKEFEKTAGYRYNPLNPSDEDLTEFTELFNKYAKEFGSPNVRASRGFDEDGKAVLKTRSSPVFNKYSNEKEMGDTFHVK